LSGEIEATFKDLKINYRYLPTYLQKHKPATLPNVSDIIHDVVHSRRRSNVLGMQDFNFAQIQSNLPKSNQF